jgi:hypothetical protein
MSQLPAAFKKGSLPPADLMIPAELKYDYMIDYMAAKFGINPLEAGKLTELDFTRSSAFEKLNNLTLQHFYEKNNDE